MTGNFKRDFKQPGKHWCKFCKIFVYNNTSCLKKHDSSPQHLANVERFIKETKKQEEIKKRFSPVTEPDRKIQGSYYRSLQTTTKVDKVDTGTTSSNPKNTQKRKIIGLLDDETASSEGEESKEIARETSPVDNSSIEPISTASPQSSVTVPFIQRRLLVDELEEISAPIERPPEDPEADLNSEEDIVVFKKKKY